MKKINKEKENKENQINGKERNENIWKEREKTMTNKRSEIQEDTE